MKNLFYAVIILIALTSCTKSQFVTLDSDAAVGRYNTFFFENDTMKVSYHFKGYDCPVNIEVFNKLSVPLYIQWTKSAMIISGRTVPFWKDESTFSSGTSTTEIDWGGVSSSHSSTNGIIRHPAGVSFIAPHATFSDTRLYLKSYFIDTASNPKAKKSKRKVFLKNGSVDVKCYEFKKEDTPFQFRSYLTISTEHDGSYPTHVANSFWVKEVLFSREIGDSYPLQDNEFRLEKATGFGTFVGATMLLGAATFVYLASSAE